MGDGEQDEQPGRLLRGRRRQERRGEGRGDRAPDAGRRFERGESPAAAADHIAEQRMAAGSPTIWLPQR